MGRRTRRGSRTRRGRRTRRVGFKAGTAGGRRGREIQERATQAEGGEVLYLKAGGEFCRHKNCL